MTKTQRQKLASQALNRGFLVGEKRVYGWGDRLPAGSQLSVNCPLCPTPIVAVIGYKRNTRGARILETPTGALRLAIDKHLVAAHAAPPKAKKAEPSHPFWSGPVTHPTYQERRMGIDTPNELRPPQRLMVSDLGLRGVPTEARPGGMFEPWSLPLGVIYYQVVDAHAGYHDAEDWLLQNGFGSARSWHYTALGEPEYFLDGEGHAVHRWLRLFMRGPERGSLVAWRG